MALRTANHRSYLMGEGSRRKELGISTVIVIPHVTACEICRLWLGVVLIDDVYSDGKQEGGEYTLLRKAIEDGLSHPNCENILATWFPDINTVLQFQILRCQRNGISKHRSKEDLREQLEIRRELLLEH